MVGNMDDRNLSQYVSDVLAEIGVTEEVVAARRNMFLCEESVDTVVCELLERDVMYRYFGSQSEGTSTIGLHSDIDQLKCILDTHIIQDISQWKPNRRNMLLKREAWMPTGYRALVPLQTDKPLPLDEISEADNDNYIRAEDNVIYLLHTHLHRSDPGGEMHGPAWASKGSGGWPDEDWINAYYCLDWPIECSQWETRIQKLRNESNMANINKKIGQCSETTHPIVNDDLYIEDRVEYISQANLESKFNGQFVQTHPEDKGETITQAKTTSKINGYIESHSEESCGNEVPGKFDEATDKFPKKPGDFNSWSFRNDGEQWLTEKIVMDIKKSGCFVIPVSHKTIANPILYRLSTTSAERILMMNLNITQLRCLILLKMLIKTYMKNLNEDRIKSFYLKTALFHLSEQQSVVLWREDNIIKVLILCIDWLIKSFEKNFMPHYFLPELDMLEGRLDDTDRESVLEVLMNISNDPLKAILDIKFDNFGDRLKMRIDTLGDVAEDTDLTSYTEHMIRIGHFLSNLYIDNFPFDYNHLLRKDSVVDFQAHIKNLRRRIEICQKITQSNASWYKKVAANRYCRLLSTTLASLYTIEQNKISDETLELFKTGIQSDPFSGRLKFATALYSMGKFEQCLDILKDAEKWYDTDSTISVCLCYRRTKLYRPKKYFEERCIERINKEKLGDVCAFCVVFLPNEKPLAPDELKHEYDRLTEEELHNLDVKQSYMKWASVDSLPYLYYLWFKVYHELEKRNQTKGRHKLDKANKTEQYLADNVLKINGQSKNITEDSNVCTPAKKRKLEENAIDNKGMNTAGEHSFNVDDVSIAGFDKQQVGATSGAKIYHQNKNSKGVFSKSYEGNGDKTDSDLDNIEDLEKLKEEQINAIEKLKQCIEVEDLNHTETALNLLGQCQIKIGLQAEAIKTLEQSVDKMPECNAARKFLETVKMDLD